MNTNKKTIVIGKDKDPYPVPLSLFRLASNLEYLYGNSYRELKDIYSDLSLDLRTRKIFGNTIKDETNEKERKNLRNINKGLTLELIASSMFSYIDHPELVHANCTVKHHQRDDVNRIAMPNNFAPSNYPDIQIHFEKFMILLEVSAKFQPPLEHFESQLASAINHARLVRKKYGKPIFCVLINERSLEESMISKALKDTLDDIQPSEEIFITATSIQEFSELGHIMSDEFEDVLTKITANDLYRMLDATVANGVNGRFHLEFLAALKAAKSPIKPLGI